MTNREKLTEVFGTHTNFENALDTDWLDSGYKEPVRYEDGDIFLTFNGSYGFFFRDSMVIEEDGKAYISTITEERFTRTEKYDIKSIYRCFGNPIYYLDNISEIKYLNIIWKNHTLLNN